MYLNPELSKNPPLLPKRTATVKSAVAVSQKSTRGRAHFFCSPRKRLRGSCPCSLASVSLFPTFYGTWGKCDESSSSLTPPTHPYPMPWLLLCHNEEELCSHNHNSFVSVSSICPFDILEEIRSKFDVEKKALISLVKGFLLPISVFPSRGRNASSRS